MLCEDVFSIQLENNMTISEDLDDKDCQNIGELILSVFKSQPDFIGQVDAMTGEQNTFQQMRRNSVKCALWLKRWGIKQGDIVTVCTHNQLNAYVPYLANLYIGAITSLWHEQISKLKVSCMKTCFVNKILANIKYFLARSKPKIIFVDSHNAEIVREIATNLKFRLKIVVFGTSNKFESLESILNYKTCEEQIENFSCAKLKSARDTVAILFSGGTTGFARDVEIPHTIFTAPSNHQIPLMSFGKVGLWFESLCWIMSLLLTVRAILTYVTAIKSEYKDEHDLGLIIEKYEVNWVFLESNMGNRLLKFDVLNIYNIVSLKQFIFGGSTIRPDIYQGLARLLPSTSIIQVYCLNEIGIIAYQRNTGKVNSSGYISKNVDLLIVDVKTGNPLDPHLIGEIWCRSPSLMNGYYKDSNVTETVIDKNGWFHTADAGYYDDDGDIFVIDRIMQLIKCRHSYVSPIEIENLLKCHPAVSEAVVVSKPHDIDEQHPMAFVTKRKHLTVTEEELKLFVAERLGDDKRLRGGVHFLNQMPRLFNGSIHRSLLCNWAKNPQINHPECKNSPSPLLY